MADKVQIDIVTTAQTAGATQVSEALKATSKEAQALGQSANAASRDVATLDVALEKLRAKRKAMISEGPQGDLEGYARRGEVISNTIDRLQGRRAAATKSNPGGDDLATSIGGGFNAPATSIAQSSGDLTGNLGKLSMVLSQAAFAIGAGVHLGDEIQKNWFNWASTLVAGGWSTDTDQTKAQQAISEQGKAISDFYERAKQLNSVDGKYQLLDAAQALQASLIAQKSGLGINETSQKAEIDQSVAQLQTFWESLFKLDPTELAAAREQNAAALKLAADQAADQISQDKYKAALNAAENRKRFDALTPEEQQQSLSSRIAAQQQIAASQVGGNFSNEDRDAARKSILSLSRELEQVEKRISAEKERQAAKDAADLEDRQKFTESATFGAKDKFDRQQEILNKKREELDLETRLNEAKATGNKDEEEKLRWLQQYNALKSQGFSDEEARRSANASLAAQNPQTSAYLKPGANPGELVPGSNYRRGRTESDLSFAMGAADRSGGSLLDAYNANRSTPVGSINGSDPTKATASNGAEAISAAAKETEKSGQALDAAVSKLAAATSGLSSGVVAGLVTKVNNLTAQVQALSKKT